MALAKAVILDTSTHEPLPVLFNPEAYTIDKSANYAKPKVQAMESEQPQFLSGRSETLSMELFFDTTDQGVDVRIFTERIARLVDKLDKKTDAPSICLFMWGTLIFRCVLESVSKKFTLFNALGMPVRATLSVRFLRYHVLDELLAKNPFRSLGHTKIHIVMQGENLSQIAWEEYQDPALWRAIADHNKISRPLELEPGMALVIPPLP